MVDKREMPKVPTASINNRSHEDFARKHLNLLADFTDDTKQKQEPSKTRTETDNKGGNQWLTIAR